jgi:hypothetical protein
MHKGQIICWIERAVLFAAALFLGAHTMPRAWRTLNTDFPNYYIAAQLVHERYDTSRMYEWAWIERQKDHRAIDIPVIGLLPITPFSTLFALPLTVLTPLAAKHVWILFNLACLIPIVCFLKSMTGLSYQRIALAIFLSFPLHRNLLYGQFYIFLLMMITAACFSYLRGFRALAGALIAIAAISKIFPALLFLFFLQRREWRALASGVITASVAIAVSIRVFGLNAHRTWLQEVLPWVMHGEGLGTYTPTPSITGVLHCLFLSEPQWNPHPWHVSVLWYALLTPTITMLALAPAILLIRRSDSSNERIILEWSALLTASLAVSTIPASYNFVVMVFPVCVVAAILIQQRRYRWLFAVCVAYLGICFPFPAPARLPGLALLLYVPRLPLMMATLFGIYALLWKREHDAKRLCDWSQYTWVTLMVASVVVSIVSTFHLETAERQEYAYRLPLQAQGYLNAAPQAAPEGVKYVAFTLDGYRVITAEQSRDASGAQASPLHDELSFASDSKRLIVEQATSPESRIVDRDKSDVVLVKNGHDPMLLADGKSIAFLRDDHGRGRLMLLRAVGSDHVEEKLLSSAGLNVYEASALSKEAYAFAAVRDGGLPQIYLTDGSHTNVAIGLTAARYPALSPNGRWMAYSHMDHGVWNLWLRDQRSGATHRIADVPCNQIQPAWESDSRTLLYGTDCGRSIWFTAVALRTVIP